MPDIPSIAFVILAIVVAIVLVVVVALRNYIKVATDQLAIFYGRGKPKFVRGGGRFRIPGIETYKIRSLLPYKVNIQVEGVPSKDNVPVNVTGFAQVAFDTSDEGLQTAMNYFLQSGDEEVHYRVTELLQGNMRDIVSGMTIEQLNNDRPELKRRVLDIATETFQVIGMHVPTLTIQGVSDNNGYLEALGMKRTAEVKRDAAIGQAEAERETRVKKAAANQAAAEAEAVATTAVAVAEQQRDVRIAQLKAQTDAEQAKAGQAGPLAEAQARAQVVVAEAAADQAREQALIAVEEQRALKSEKAQRADVIVPAEAERQAMVLRAEGQREATIATAQADAEQVKLSGQADAEARTVQAQAMQAEMEAQAAGEVAKLKAQAEGTRELADAQNAFTESAQRLQVLPKVIEALPAIAAAVAAPMGNIDKMVVLDGGNGGGSGVSNVVPRLILQTLEAAKLGGIDLGALLGSADSVTEPTQQPAAEPTVPASPASSESDDHSTAS